MNTKKNIPVILSHDQSYKSNNKPNMYRSIVQINEIVNKYIDNCKMFKELPNEPGLSLYMGFSSMNEMGKWYIENKKFGCCLLRARTILESIGIQRMTDPGNKNGNGSHRYMSKAFGYNDKLDIDSNITTRIIRLPAKVVPGSPIPAPGQKKKPSKNKK